MAGNGCVCGARPALVGAAQLAQDAGVKKLVLVHMGPNLASQTPFDRHIEEKTPMYDGEIIFSEELMRLEV